MAYDSRTIAVLIFLCLASPPIAADDERPNIVIVLCDDLGWGDLQNYGHPHIKTPRLLQLANAGIQFSSFYSAAPVCSPSRVGLLTGRSPNRAGVFDWIPAANAEQPIKQSRQLVQMRREEMTIPRMLKDAGYATCMVGKWHCNAMFNSQQQAQPNDHGFEHWFATQNNAAPSHENPTNFVRNGEPVGKLQGFSCQIVAEEAIDWLEKHKRKQNAQPFFLYMAFHEPHEPVASPGNLVSRYLQAGAGNKDEAQYFANVENMDAATGRLMDTLQRLEYTENTLVIFTSDNGPETLNRYRTANRSYGTPGKFRGMKLHTHEAGFRVAGLMKWPGIIKAGSRSDIPVSALDFLPTFADLCDIPLPRELTVDGVSILPLLKGKPFSRPKPLLWAYYNSFDGKSYVPTVAMRDGAMKVRAALEGFPRASNIDEGNVAQLKSAKLVNFEIYNLDEDPSESHPLDPSQSQLPDRLREQYRELLDDSYVWPVPAQSRKQGNSMRKQRQQQTGPSR